MSINVFVSIRIDMTRKTAYVVMITIPSFFVSCQRLRWMPRTTTISEHMRRPTESNKPLELICTLSSPPFGLMVVFKSQGRPRPRKMSKTFEPIELETAMSP